MKTKTIFLCALLSMFTLSYAQDQVLINPNQSLIQLNPSFAGSNDGIRNQSTLQYRISPFFGNSGAYQSSTDAYLERLHVGVALIVSGYRYADGIVRNTSIGAVYAQHVSFFGGKLKVIPSVQVGYGQKVFDGQGQWTVNVGSGQNYKSISYSRTGYLDVSGGLLVNYKNKLYLGGSIKHLNTPDSGPLDPYGLPKLVQVHASYNMAVSSKVQLQLLANVSSQLYDGTATLAANALLFNHVMAGIGYSLRNTPLMNLGYKGKCFTVCGSYSFYAPGYDFTNTVPVAALNFSFNFRKKEMRGLPASFESW